MTRLRQDSEDDIVEEVVRVYSAAVKAYAARASVSKVHEALASSLRDQWIIAMADEISETMINTTRTLKPEDIDTTPYHHAA